MSHRDLLRTGGCQPDRQKRGDGGDDAKGTDKTVCGGLLS
jgi:hypothetical protein